MIRLIFVIAVLQTGSALAQYPDGTIALSSGKRLIGRIAKRITGQHYTHIGVIIEGQVYEHDWPVAKRTPVQNYGKRGWTIDFYAPNTPYTTTQVSSMRNAASSRIGKRYNLRGFWRGNSPGTSGSWCSPFAGNALNASGRYSLSLRQVHTPGNIYNTVGNDFTFVGRKSL